MTENSGLKALINTTPAAGETVTVSGVSIPLRPITVIELIALLKRFPSLKGMLLGFAAGKEPTREAIVEGLLSEGVGAIAAVIATAGGAKGDLEVEAGLIERPDEDLITLLDATIRITMPHGLQDFFGRFAKLAGAMGLVVGEEKGTVEAA